MPIPLTLDTLSGITGSISIACWIVVFSPQIIENQRRKSAEGISVAFLIIWLAGDVFNILGSVLQGVLPTMMVLAVYYTAADVALLVQVWCYRRFTISDAEDAEREPLVVRDRDRVNSEVVRGTRSGSFTSIRRHLSFADPQHLSPVTPLLKVRKRDYPPQTTDSKQRVTLRTVLFNVSAVLVVCAAGVVGWWLTTSSSTRHGRHRHTEEDMGMREIPQFDTLGQVFGYLCAALYLGSRVPQILLNYKRKSTEGVSLLFFLFACLGNLTYDVSIFAYDPALHCVHGRRHCAVGEQRMIYLRYIAVNASWIIGSMGTLVLDFAIFVQFFLYRKTEKQEDAEEEGEEWDCGGSL